MTEIDSTVDLEPIVQEIFDSLGGKVSKDTLRNEVERYVVTYKTGVNVAKDSIIRRYSAPKVTVSNTSVTKKIAELEGTEMMVNIVAKIIHVERRTIATKTGGSKDVISGIIGDDTGTTPFTIWEITANYEEGKVYTFKGAYTKKWNNQVQVNIGSRGKVEPNDEVTFDDTVSVSSVSISNSPVSKKIAELDGTETSLNLVVKIVSAEKKEVTIRNEPATIVSGTLGDDTGTIAFTIWRNEDVQVGSTYNFNNVYAKVWRDQVQINVGNNGTIEPNSDVSIEVSGKAPVAAAPSSSSSVTKKVAELTGTESSVNIVAKLVFVSKKEVVIREVPTTIVSGILGDETGSVPFTIWRDMDNLEKNSVYSFNNAYSNKRNDQVQVNVGINGTVEPKTDVVIDRIPQTASISSNAKDVAIGDINEQSKNVNIIGRISNVQARTIVLKNGNGNEEKTVWGGLIADSTGKVQFNAWNDFGLKDGETISIKDAYIRTWKGIPQVNLSERSIVTRVEGDIGAVAESTKKTVDDIMKVGGGLDITITGTVVDIRTGSGLIQRCPECRRSVLNNVCNVCNKTVDPIMDLRLKLTIDDGTGAISAIVNCNDTEKLTGMTLAQAIELANEKNDPGAVANKMSSILLLKKMAVSGNIMTDPEFGPQMSVHHAEIVQTDIEAEADKLFKEVEGML